MNAKLLQLSGVMIDLTYRVETVPKPGNEAVVRDFFLAPGGGFNAMQAARQVGIDVVYGARIGSGPLADIAMMALSRAGVTQSQRRHKEEQGACVVLIDAHGERTLIAQEGAEGNLHLDDLIASNPASFDCTLLSGYQTSYAQSRKALTAWISSLPATNHLIFDPSPAFPQIPHACLETVLQRAWWISASSDEARAIAGTQDIRETMRILAGRRQRKDGGILVRDGANGCWLFDEVSNLRHIPPHPVEAIDTNGAGDTHIGSFAARLVQGATADNAARYANIAAGIAVTKTGAATAPLRSEVEALLD